MIQVGCCGWPVGREEYFKRLSTIEIDATFFNMPRLATIAGWRAEAPAGFVFSLRALQLITHTAASPTYKRLTAKLGERAKQRCGHFRESIDVFEAWQATRQAAEALGARFIMFQTPASFLPDSDHLRDMYRFFKGLKRGPALLVWEPRGRDWNANLVRKVCGDLDLVHGTDPFNMAPVRGVARYFRLRGRYEGGRVDPRTSYSAGEFKELEQACSGKPAYVFFDHDANWNDAQRFKTLARAG
jgi:uncharacterized protein YecE (DUF72 family)